jgi:hypothetical protein
MFDINQAMAFGWREMDEQGRAGWQQQFEEEKRSWELEKQGSAGGGARQSTLDPARPTPAGDEDVEMADDVESHSGGDGGGFTAVNRP